MTFLSQNLHANELLMKKISDNLKEFFVINISNLRLKIFDNSFLSWDTKSYHEKKINEVLKNLPKNFTLVNPINIKELKIFLEDKEFLLINSIGKTFPEFNIHFKIMIIK